MGMLVMMKYGTYTNNDAVSKLIHYITRTRWNEARAHELCSYGGMGVGCYLHPDQIIKQLLAVQQVYGISSRKGRRMYHEVFILNDEEWINKNINMEMFALECCQIYFQNGHQVVCAIHYDDKGKLHIHFAINTINYINGKKFHTSMKDVKLRGEIFNEILKKYSYAANI